MWMADFSFIKAGQLQWLPVNNVVAKWPDFHIRWPYKEFISGQADQFYQGLAKRIATLSTRWPFYQEIARFMQRAASLI